jgi:putative endonuclease
MKKLPKKYSLYYLYILECQDKTLYTGIATDLQRRIGEHNDGKTGAKYTRGRRPVKLVFSKKFKSRSAALVEECRIKRMTRKEKKGIVRKK